MMDKDQSILITGATGFVGSYIIRTLLSHGYHKLHATHRATSSFDLVADVQQHVRWIEADLSEDILSNDQLGDIQVIIHAAALVSLDKKDKSTLFQVNIEGTSSLVDFALAAGVRRFIYISSATALGQGVDAELIDEMTEWEETPGLSDYAISKQYAEREVYRGMMEGLEVIILSPSMIIGGGYWDQPPLNLFGLIHGGLSFYPNGSTGVVDVRDVAQMASLMVCDDEHLGQKMILSAEYMGFKALNGLIADALSVAAPDRPLSPLLGRIATIYDFIRSKVMGRQRIITKQSIAIAEHEYRYDNSRSKSVMDFRYRTVEESIAEVSEAWLLSHEAGQAYRLLDI